ncbi:MAG: Phage integrase family protein, partial [uncultured Blastococcus sp.]
AAVGQGHVATGTWTQDRTRAQHHPDPLQLRPHGDAGRGRRPHHQDRPIGRRAAAENRQGVVDDHSRCGGSGARAQRRAV